MSTTYKRLKNVVLSASTISNLYGVNISTTTLIVTNTTIGNINVIGTFLQNGNTYTASQWTSTSGNISYTSGSIIGVNASINNIITSNITVGNIIVNSFASLISNSNTIGSLFTTGGNIGINTTSPSFLLDVNGNGKFTTFITTGAVYSNNITTTNLVTTIASLGNMISLTGTFANKVGTNQTVGTIVVNSFGSLIGNSNTIGSLFTTGGNIGINTVSPQSTLSIISTTISSNAPTGNGIFLGQDSSTYQQIQLNSTIGSYIDFSTSAVDTLGRIIYTNSSKTLAIMNNNSSITLLSNGNIGINNGSPTYILDIISSTATDAIRITNTNSVGYASISYKNNVNSIGYIGVGGSTTGSLSNKIYVTGLDTIYSNGTNSTNISSGCIIVNGGIGVSGNINIGGGISLQSDQYIYLQSGSTNSAIHYNAATSSINYDSNSHLFYSNGTQELYIYGNGIIISKSLYMNNNNQIFFQSASTANAIGYNSADGTLHYDASSQHTFYSNGTQELIINNNGVSISNTLYTLNSINIAGANYYINNNNDTNHRLYYVGLNDGPRLTGNLSITLGTTGKDNIIASGTEVYIGNIILSTGTYAAIFSGNGSGDQFQVRANGLNGGAGYFFYNSANNYGTSSDKRIKKNIINIDLLESENFIKALNPVKFELIDCKDNSKQCGFIAQEILKICINDEQRNCVNNWETYNEHDIECPKLGISDKTIVSNLVGALKNAFIKIEEQNNKIDILTNFIKSKFSDF